MGRDRGSPPAPQASSVASRRRVLCRAVPTGCRAGPALDEVELMIDSAPLQSAQHRKTSVRSRRRAAVALSIAIGLATAIGPGGRPRTTSPPSIPGPERRIKSTHRYRTSKPSRHADDPNSFVPGDAVTVPYRPRAATPPKWTAEPRSPCRPASHPADRWRRAPRARSGPPGRGRLAFGSGPLAFGRGQERGTVADAPGPDHRVR